MSRYGTDDVRKRATALAGTMVQRQVEISTAIKQETLNKMISKAPNVSNVSKFDKSKSKTVENVDEKKITKKVVVSNTPESVLLQKEEDAISFLYDQSILPEIYSEAPLLQATAAATSYFSTRQKSVDIKSASPAAAEYFLSRQSSNSSIAPTTPNAQKSNDFSPSAASTFFSNRQPSTLLSPSLPALLEEEEDA